MKKILNSIIVSAIFLGGYQLTTELVKPIHAQAVAMPTVQMGARGDAVKTLQNALNLRGYKLLADGSFGQLTKNAVINFQSKNGLYQDGIVATKTWAALGYSGTTTTPAMPIVQIGARGDAVKTLQNTLNARGYKLLADGSFGQLTKNAVINFQAKNGLYQDGIVAAKTWAALGYGSTSTGQVGAQTQKIIDYVNSKVGTSYGSGYCQAFVRDSYEKAGIFATTNAGSAKIAADRWTKSTSQSNIPIGACVYFEGTKANSYLGHVGIYVGNGNIVHATGGKVLKQQLSYMTQNNKFIFRSWGYQAGVQPN
ncbi:NlpC/P60 family protein [Listeria booriae]|uniref:NlpC/P60 family protein n=1 Tax=Listeria booriae TaxID=1552123 RepID=UPI0016268CA4|nr:peptidoglycan-binding protein [Listeria booriae]MBC1246538.1 hypothetical protein [Listeria booriae]